MDLTLERRARHLSDRLAPHLPPSGSVVDVGCGTGHNAEALEARLGLSVQGVDVVDLSTRGPAPTLLQGRRLPFDDDAFDAGLLLFVLQYPDDPGGLLAEASRVVVGPLLVIQSTCQGSLARLALAGRSRLQGRGAYDLASTTGLVKPGGRDALTPRRAYDRRELLALFEQAGRRVTALSPEPSLAPGLSRDLFRLERP